MNEKNPEGTGVLAEYTISTGGEFATVSIRRGREDFVDLYEVKHAKVREATQVALNWLREKIVETTPLKVSELLDPREAEAVRFKVYERAKELVSKELMGLSPKEEDFIVGRLVHEMLGLGEIDLLLADENLEEIVINSAREPLWVYHKKFGWLKTNIYLQSEEQIQNYSTIIGRKVGKQISNLAPLMDAHLLSGDRVNATLFPISSKGNSITIRKFAKDPWTIVTLTDNGTVSYEASALFWLAMQFELNLLIGGGTASGKTSLLNAVLAFTPPNQRVISIEDSVAGESEMLYEENGKMQKSTIAELVDGKIKVGGEVLPDGTEVALNKHSTKVFSMSKEGKIELVEPSTFIRHKVSKPLYEVETHSGKKIKVTGDHALFTKLDGKIVSIKTNQLKLGGVIATAPSVENVSNDQIQLQLQLCWESVQKITPLKRGEIMVYDLSVPKNESFICNNIVAHNTRELLLPDFLHWTPMATRQPNPEGKGGVEMLDLMVNSLRMRPDRIVVGEIRRQREAEVMFEAMHTGHAVYSTVHADDVTQVKNRLINPPISLPESVLGAMHLVSVQYRQRRTGIRRILQIAEVVPKPNGAVQFNVAYRWDARKDKLVKVAPLKRVYEDLALHTGWTTAELVQDLQEKEKLLHSMKKHNVTKVNDIGKLVAEYYQRRDNVLELMKEDKGFESILLK